MIRRNRSYVARAASHSALPTAPALLARIASPRHNSARLLASPWLFRLPYSPGAVSRHHRPSVYGELRFKARAFLTSAPEFPPTARLPRTATQPTQTIPDTTHRGHRGYTSHNSYSEPPGESSSMAFCQYYPDPMLPTLRAGLTRPPLASSVSQEPPASSSTYAWPCEAAPRSLS